MAAPVLDDTDAATRYFYTVACREGLVEASPSDPWPLLDREVERLTGRDPESLSPREWIALARAIEEAPA
jgi:hypothetical protein